MLNPSKEWQYFAAAVVIGDGVMGLLRPQSAGEAWAFGPEWWKNAMRFFRDCPTLTRALAAAEVAAGIYWALSQQSSETDHSPS